MMKEEQSKGQDTTTLESPQSSNSPHILFTDLPLADRRALCRESILCWAMQDRPYEMKPYWHSKLIDRELTAVDDRKSRYRYMLLSQPPRTGKTLLSMLYGGTRYLAMNPDHHVWVVSHNQTIADKFGRQAKAIFERHAPEIFGVRLDKKNRSNSHWGVHGHEGSFNAIGWGGSITGNKVHRLVLDDLIKDTNDALSMNIRDQIWDWWDGTVSQRIENSSHVQTICISVQTRWHVDDLNGRLIQQERSGGAMKWRKLILPAIADRGDIVFDGKVIMKHGDVLCPEILPRDQIENLRRNKARYWWETTYQQRPLTQDGILWSSDLFTDDLFTEEWPQRLQYLVIAVDPATGRALRDGDYSSIVALGIGYDGKLYTEASMEKSGPQETTKRLMDFIRKMPMAPDLVGIESQGFQFLMRGMAEEALKDEDLQARIVSYDIEERDVPVRKEDRIAELDPLIVNRDINFIRSPGTAMLVSQLQNFPSQDHDDGPDALELASWMLAQFT